MSEPTRTPTLIGEYNERYEAMRDVFTASKNAELQVQNEGLIRVLCEILTALHRQAHALERQNSLLAEVIGYLRVLHNQK